MAFMIRRFYSSVVEKTVLISRSTDVFENLALEHWYYRHSDFTNKSMLLLWVNSNSVVIGRHQNPWLEVNFDPAIDLRIARRNSGGGTVFHDNENLNMTFFTNRDIYNRKQNLELIVETLKNEWNVVTEINKREDIVIDNMYKISGTASKLGRPNAYHHCTLLVNCNRELMSNLLRKREKNIETNATVSVTSDVLNLTQINNKVCINRLMTAVGLQYLKTVGNTTTINQGFNYVTPNEQTFPGFNEIKNEMESWEWIYGRTPKFNITVKCNDQSVILSVKNGIIENVATACNVSLNNLVNEKFNMNIVEEIKQHLKTIKK
ncbi:unnamed protein product [Macrosiphum euphorbiae]|uniref:BPL/LPL catalytic domain-containing protein n=1 Tax=Macrosiphum euphorbiae TaxID=13131 RepID=A0AAV0VP27_9HEMI|nr:unnamed protein product [Macrosiphum euphorbiae]